MANMNPKTTREHIVSIYGYITGLKKDITSIKKNGKPSKPAVEVWPAATNTDTGTKTPDFEVDCFFLLFYTHGCIFRDF